MATLDVETAYRTYFPVIRAKCSRMLRHPSDAQDVAQETFTRLWEERDRVAEPDAVLAWIYRTSTRLAIDRCRRQTTRAEVEPENDDVAADERSSQATVVETRQLLTRLSQRIPADELAVVLLERLDGLNQEEIGVVVGASARTVRRTLRRFEARLERFRKEHAI